MLSSKQNQVICDRTEKPKFFKNHCNCGGYAWTMNGRPESQPHMAWCPQLEEYAEWYATIKHSAKDED